MSMGTGRLDFDALVALHQRDPGAFEDLRRQLLREAVDCAPPEHRPALEQLLCRIEAARDAANSPLEAAIAASRMMHGAVGELRNAWEQARCAIAELQSALIIEGLRTR
jgi:hypothetical protein